MNKLRPDLIKLLEETRPNGMQMGRGRQIYDFYLRNLCVLPPGLGE